MGYKNWQKQSKENDFKQIPHNPKFNGLSYLHQYSLEEANRIMTSPEYTRAIFVRDPKERFLSAFLDKATSNGGAHVQNKCCPSGDCIKEAQTFPGFINLVFNKGCRNPHWNSQSRRMEPKYWKVGDLYQSLVCINAVSKEYMKTVPLLGISPNFAHICVSSFNMISILTSWDMSRQLPATLKSYCSE